MRRFELEAVEKPGSSANRAVLLCAAVAMMLEAVAVVISRDDGVEEEIAELLSNRSDFPAT